MYRPCQRRRSLILQSKKVKKPKRKCKVQYNSTRECSRPTLPTSGKLPPYKRPNTNHPDNWVLQLFSFLFIPENPRCRPTVFSTFGHRTLASCTNVLSYINYEHTVSKIKLEHGLFFSDSYLVLINPYVETSNMLQNRTETEPVPYIMWSFWAYENFLSKMIINCQIFTFPAHSALLFHFPHSSSKLKRF